MRDRGLDAGVAGPRRVRGEGVKIHLEKHPHCCLPVTPTPGLLRGLPRKTATARWPRLTLSLEVTFSVVTCF